MIGKLVHMQERTQTLRALLASRNPGSSLDIRVAAKLRDGHIDSGIFPNEGQVGDVMSREAAEASRFLLRVRDVPRMKVSQRQL